MRLLSSSPEAYSQSMARPERINQAVVDVQLVMTVHVKVYSCAEMWDMSHEFLRAGIGVCPRNFEHWDTNQNERSAGPAEDIKFN